MVVIKVAPVLYRLFAFFVLLIAVTPMSNRFVQFAGYNLSYSDLLMVFLLLLTIPLLWKTNIQNKQVKRSYKLLLFILAYACFSTLWADYDVHGRYIFYQVALAFLTVTIPYLVSKITKDKHIDYHKMITNFSVVLSVILVIYMFQMDGKRLDGLIGGAAIIHMAIVPCFAVFLYNLAKGKKVITSIVFLVVTFLAVMFTASRAALITLILLVIVFTLQKLTIKKLLSIIVIAIAGIFMVVGYWQDSRYAEMGFGDDSRSINTQTSIQLSLNSPATFFFGNGYGDIWSWYSIQQGIKPGNWVDPNLLATEKGYVMFHAHSTFNNLIAELGLVGTIPFILFLLILLKEFVSSLKRKDELVSVILGALICTIPTMHTDLFLFRNWEVSLIWFFFFFTALTYSNKSIQ